MLNHFLDFRGIFISQDLISFRKVKQTNEWVEVKTPLIFYQRFRETQSGMYDMILHVGDFAYDMDTVSDFI